MVAASSITFALVVMVAGILDMIGDVPVVVALVAAVASLLWFSSMFVLQRWVTGTAVDRRFLIGASLVLAGNLLEGFGGQMNMKVGSSGILFLLAAIVVVLVRNKGRWRTLQVGLLATWSAITAAAVYTLLSMLFEDVIARIDESVLITASPGIVLVLIATATRRALHPRTRILGAAALVTLIVFLGLIFLVEWSVLVAALALAIAAGGWTNEAISQARL